MLWEAEISLRTFVESMLVMTLPILVVELVLFLGFLDKVEEEVVE